MRKYLNYFIGNSNVVYVQLKHVPVFAFLTSSSNLVIVFGHHLAQYNIDLLHGGPESHIHSNYYGSHKIMWVAEHQDEPLHHCAVYIADRQFVCTGDDDGCIRVYDVSRRCQTPKFILGKDSIIAKVKETTSESPKYKYYPDQIQLTAHDGPIVALAFVAPDKIISGGADGFSRLWSLKSKEQIRCYIPQRSNNLKVSLLCYNEIHKTVTISYNNGELHQFDVESGQKLLSLGNVQNPQQITALSVMNRSQLIVFANENNVVRIWDLIHDQENSRFSFNTSTMIYESRKNVLFTASKEGDVKVWKSVVEELLQQQRRLQEVHTMKIHNAPISSIWYHPEEDIAVTISKSEKRVAICKEIVARSLAQLDDKIKAQFVEHFVDYDIQLVKHLSKDEIDELIARLNDADYNLEDISINFEKSQDEEKLYELAYNGIEKLINNGKDVNTNCISILKELREKKTKLDERIEVEKKEISNFLLKNHSRLQEKYQVFIDDKQYEKSMIELQNKSKEDLNILLKRHEQERLAMERRQSIEIKDFERKSQEKYIEFEKSKNVEKGNAARTFKSIHDTYLKRLQSLDEEAQIMIHQMIEDITFQNDELLTKDFQLQQYKILSYFNPKVSSNVFLGLSYLDHELVCIKQFPVSLHLDDSIVHKNIVSIKEIICTERKTLVVCEKMDESLSDFLRRKSTLPRKEVYHILKEVTSALSYLHENSYVKRDLRPEKIFIKHNEDSSFSVKLPHVGIMKALNGNEPSHTVSEGLNTCFSAPEVLLQEIDFFSDIWSYGCLFVHLLQSEEIRKSKPFLKSSQKMTKILLQMAEYSGVAKERISEMAKNIKSQKARKLLLEVRNLLSDENDSLFKWRDFLPDITAQEEILLKKIFQFHPKDRCSLDHINGVLGTLSSQNQNIHTFQ